MFNCRHETTKRLEISKEKPLQIKHFFKIHTHDWGRGVANVSKEQNWEDQKKMY